MSSSEGQKRTYSSTEGQKRILFGFEILNLGINNRPTWSCIFSVPLHYFPHTF